MERQNPPHGHPTPAAWRQPLLGGNCDGSDMLSTCPHSAYPSRFSMGRYMQPTGDLEVRSVATRTILRGTWKAVASTLESWKQQLPTGRHGVLHAIWGSNRSNYSAPNTERCYISADTNTHSHNHIHPRLSTHMSRLWQDMWLPDWALQPPSMAPPTAAAVSTFQQRILEVTSSSK